MKEESKKITVNLYASKYGKNVLVDAVLNKNIGFELEISESDHIIRKLISYKDLLSLRDDIDSSIAEYLKFKHT